MHKQLPTVILIAVILVAVVGLFIVFKGGAPGAGQAPHGPPADSGSGSPQTPPQPVPAPQPAPQPAPSSPYDFGDDEAWIEEFTGACLELCGDRYGPVAIKPGSFRNAFSNACQTTGSFVAKTRERPGIEVSLLDCEFNGNILEPKTWIKGARIGVQVSVPTY